MSTELNHAKCIENLDFIKFDWDSRDLSRFHRPSLERIFEELGEEIKRGANESDIHLNEKMAMMRKGGLNLV